MKIGIVGLGLIGGSLAIDFKNVGHTVSGVDLSKIHGDLALELGIVDKLTTIKEMVDACKVIIVAIPVDHISQVVLTTLDLIKPHQVVIDVGSTKEKICREVRHHKNRARFVAAHPLAGTEFSGPKAAIEGLYRGKKNIICEEELVEEDALDLAIELFNGVGMSTTFMDPSNHDRHLAYVSHLSHVSSFMLGLTVLDIEKDEKQITNLASTGFESTVRLAKSSPSTWSAIFCDNNEHLSTALGAYIQQLQLFKNHLDQSKKPEIKSMLFKANNIKKSLRGLKHNILKLS